MIRKRAKPQRIADLRDDLCDADAALCRAALTNVLTGRQEQRLRDLLHVLRIFTDDLERHIPSDRLPSSPTPPPAQRAAHGGTDDRKADAVRDSRGSQRAGQAIRGGDDA